MLTGQSKELSSTMQAIFTLRLPLRILLSLCFGALVRTFFGRFHLLHVSGVRLLLGREGSVVGGASIGSRLGFLLASGRGRCHAERTGAKGINAVGTESTGVRRRGALSRSILMRWRSLTRRSHRRVSVKAHLESTRHTVLECTRSTVASHATSWVLSVRFIHSARVLHAMVMLRRTLVSRVVATVLGETSSTVASSHATSSTSEAVAAVHAHAVAEAHVLVATVATTTTIAVAVAIATTIAVAISATSASTSKVVVVTTSTPTTHLLSLELGLDSLSVRSVSDHGQDRLDVFDQDHALRRIRVVESGLNDVIGKRVSEQLLQSVSVQELANKDLSKFRVGHSDALLNDVGREFLDRESTDVTNELPDEGFTKSVVVEVKNVLNDVVTERILNQRKGVVSDLGHQLDSLSISGVIDAPLQDTASVSVGSDLDAVCGDGVVDELVVLRNEPVETLLDDVVPVEILDQANDVQAEGEDDGSNLVGLSRVREEIDHLLNSSSSVHVERDGDKIVSDGFADDVPLFLCRVFEQFLAEIVSERVGHQLWEVTVGLPEDHVTVLRDLFLQLFLKVSATMLVLAECQEFSLKVFDSHT